MAGPESLKKKKTRRAESRTSIPPPDPRSSTISPSCSSANAVGLPQPSEASRAPSGSAAVSAASYRFELTGSQLQLPPCPPPSTRVAAWPYFAFTVSLISSPLMGCNTPGRSCRRACRASQPRQTRQLRDRKSTRLNSSHLVISYAVFCLKKKNRVFHEILNASIRLLLLISKHHI